MAAKSKMFVHYKGTVAAFKEAGLESVYNNHIVFIKGGEADGKGVCAGCRALPQVH